MPHHTKFYPMPMFPTLSVGDIRASASWYVDKLGSSNVFTIPRTGGEIALAHLRWSKYADLLLAPDVAFRPTHPRGLGVTLSFLTESETIDDMAARFEASGVEIAEGPIDRPWNTRDIVVIDPDGYKLNFFEPIDSGRTFEDVIESVRQQG